MFLTLFKVTILGKIQEISCVPNTPNTMANCIGALVRRRDGDTSVVWIVDIGFCNLKYKNSKVASSKSGHKRSRMSVSLSIFAALYKLGPQNDPKLFPHPGSIITSIHANFQKFLTLHAFSTVFERKIPEKIV